MVRWALVYADPFACVCVCVLSSVGMLGYGCALANAPLSISATFAAQMFYEWMARGRRLSEV